MSDKNIRIGTFTNHYTELMNRVIAKEHVILILLLPQDASAHTHEHMANGKFELSKDRITNILFDSLSEDFVKYSFIQFKTGNIQT